MLSIRLFLIVFALTSLQQAVSTAIAAGHNDTDESTAAWSDVDQIVIDQLSNVTSTYHSDKMIKKISSLPLIVKVKN